MHFYRTARSRARLMRMGLRGGALAILVCACCAWGQGVWEPRAPYPVEATEVSAAALDGKIYAVCGLTAQGSINSLYIYDPRTDTWAAGASLPIDGGADHCNVAAARGRLYVLGAIRVGTSFIDGNTYEYDPTLDRWQTVARMAVPRGASGVAAIGGSIYVAGGLAAIGSVADFEAFDTGARQWTTLPAMPTARDHLTAQAANNLFYAISGRVGDVLRVNEEYDPVTGRWTARAPIPTPRGGLGSGALNKRIQVFGGEGPSGTPQGTYPQNEEYDPATDTWRTLTPMPVPRHGLYGATLDGRIFTPSGGPAAGANFSDVHQAFYLPPAGPVTAVSLLDAAGFGSAVAPGTLVSVFGTNFAFGEQVAPVSTRMNAVEARVNGRPARLLYTAPQQVNFELPLETAVGDATLVVSNAGVQSAPLSFRVNTAAPAIFTVDAANRGAILIAGTGELRAARRGETVGIYCTGLGLPPILGLHVTIGGEEALVFSAGPVARFPGLYQVNARVPGTAPSGAAVPVSLRIGEITGNAVTLGIED